MIAIYYYSSFFVISVYHLFTLITYITSTTSDDVILSSGWWVNNLKVKSERGEVRLYAFRVENTVTKENSDRFKGTLIQVNCIVFVNVSLNLIAD